MTMSIDCSRVSHASCYAADELEPIHSAQTTSPSVLAQRESEADASDADDGASYECVNDCVSSLGVTVLLSGAVTSLGCILAPPACPVFIGTSVGSVLGACELACEDLESKP